MPGEWTQHCLCAAEQACSPATAIGTEPQHKAAAPAATNPLPGGSNHEDGSAGHVRHMAPAGPTEQEDASREALALADDMDMDTVMGGQDALHQTEPDQLLSPAVPIPTKQAQTQQPPDAATAAASEDAAGRSMLASVSAVSRSAQPADCAPAMAAPELRHNKTQAQTDAPATAPFTAPKPTSVVNAPDPRHNETRAALSAVPAKAHSGTQAALSGTHPHSSHQAVFTQQIPECKDSIDLAEAVHSSQQAVSGNAQHGQSGNDQSTVKALHSSQQAVPGDAQQSQPGISQTAAKAVHSSQQALPGVAQQSRANTIQTAAKAVHSSQQVMSSDAQHGQNGIHQMAAKVMYSSTPGQEAKPTALQRRTSNQIANKNSRKAVDGSPAEGTRMSLRSRTQGPDQKRRKTNGGRADRSRRAPASSRAGVYATRYGQQNQHLDCESLGISGAVLRLAVMLAIFPSVLTQ